VASDVDRNEVLDNATILSGLLQALRSRTSASGRQQRLSAKVLMQCIAWKCQSMGIQ
jgi:hypothetical protein